MKQANRLNKLEHNLTSKEAVILWLQEANRYSDVMEYLKYLRGRPESLRPIPRVTNQVESATREAMRGQPQKTIDAAVHRAVRDVCFLMKLHHQVNGYLMTEVRLWGIMFAALEGNLRAITRENTHQRFLGGLADIYSRFIPYPLDPETAGTVSAAIRNNVTTWDEFDGGDILEEWFNDYLLDHGERELPQGVYKYDGEKWQPVVTADNEKEIRDCFQNDIEFE